MAILESILTKAGIAAAKLAYEKLSETSSAKAAIAKTETHFALEGVETGPGLRSWCDSDAFADISLRISRADIELDDKEIVESFLREGNVYFGNDPKLAYEKGTEIIAFFAQEFRELELKGPGSSLIISDQLAEVKNILQSDVLKILQSKNEDQVAKLVEEQAFSNRLDQITRWLEKRQYLYGQELLLGLLEEVKDKPLSKDEIGRIHNNLGICSLHLGDTENAATEFARALLLNPDNPKFLANSAMQALLVGDGPRTVELATKARSLDPTNPHAASALIQGLGISADYEKIESLTEDEPWIVSDAVCLLALGAAALSNHEYAKAEEYLRKSLEKNPEEPQCYKLLSMAILHPHVDVLQSDAPIRWRKSESIEEALAEAKVLANEAVLRFKNGDSWEQYRSSLLNYAQINAILGCHDEVIRTCEQILIKSPSDKHALDGKGMAHYNQGQFAEAASCLELIITDSTFEAQIPILAVSYINTDQAKKAIEIIEPYFDPASTAEHMIRLADILSAAYLKDGKVDDPKLIEIAYYLSEKFPHNADACLVRSEILYSRGKTSEARNEIFKGLKNATDNQADKLKLTLANQAFFRNDWSEAADYYSQIVNDATPQTLKQWYVTSLYNNKQLEKALGVAKEARGTGPAIPVISEIEASILESIGEVPAALELHKQLHEQTSDESEGHLIKAYLLTMRQGREDAAREILASIDVRKARSSAWSLAQLATAYKIHNIDGAIPLAYEARRIGFSYPDFHLLYVTIFVARENSEAEDFRPEQVGPDCVVELSLSNGRKQIFTISDDEPADHQRGVLRTSDAVAQKLLGKKKGETVIFKSDEFETLTGSVDEIKSKYVFAFQESFLNFSTLFPDSSKMTSIDVSNNDFSKIFSQLDRRYSHLRYVMQLHRENRLPLSITSELVDRSRIKGWNRMISDDEGNIFATRGDLADAEGTIGSSRVVVDLVAILTLKYLGLLTDLPRIFNEIYTPQAVLDEISKELLSERSESKQGRTSLTRVKDGYASHEFSENEIQSYVDFLEELRDFVTTQTKVVGAPGALGLDRAKFDEMSKVLGLSSLSAILIAKDRNALLCADDIAVAQIASTEWNVATIWTQIVLANALKHGRIDKNKYNEGIYNLIIANYRGVTYNGENIVWAVRENEWKSTPKLARFLGVLTGANCNDENWAIESCAELIKLSATEISQTENRLFFLDFLVRILTTGRNKVRIIDKLIQRMIVKLDLLPIQLSEILMSLNYWRSR